MNNNYWRQRQFYINDPCHAVIALKQFTPLDGTLPTQMFHPQRTTEDLEDAIRFFPGFLVTYLAIAWSIYIAGSIPDEDSRIYSGRYLVLNVDSDSFLNVLISHVIEKSLLPDYRLGFFVAFLKACHMTTPIEAQKCLWREFVSQLSNFLASASAHTELGIILFEEFTNRHTGLEEVAD